LFCFTRFVGPICNLLVFFSLLLLVCFLRVLLFLSVAITCLLLQVTSPRHIYSSVTTPNCYSLVWLLVCYATPSCCYSTSPVLHPYLLFPPMTTPPHCYSMSLLPTCNSPLFSYFFCKVVLAPTCLLLLLACVSLDCIPFPLFFVGSH